MPAGIHDCELAEVKAPFVYNGTRQTVWNQFSLFLTNLLPIREIDVIYVDGSFVTDKTEPGDIDAIVEVADMQTLNRLWLQHPQYLQNDAVKRNYNIDLWFAVTQGQMPYDLREFFQYLRPEEAIDRGVPAGTTKGILKISLNDERLRQNV